MINLTNNYAILHCHSCYSWDSSVSIQELVSKAKELGSKAIALTDHGVTTGLSTLLTECWSARIKPILGIEAYVSESEDTGLTHLVILARNVDGLIAIRNAENESRSRIIDGHPCMNRKILLKYFGLGSKGYGNVVILSACISGPLAKIILNNRMVKMRIDRILYAQQHFIDPASSKVKIIRRKLEDAILQKKSLEKKCELFQNSEDKEILQTSKKELSSINSKILRLQKEWRRTSESTEKFMQCERKIQNLRKQYKNDLFQIAKTEAAFFQTLAGKDSFYIELQYHYNSNEEYCIHELLKLSKELNIPVVATNDVHFAHSEQAMERVLIMSLEKQKYMAQEEGSQFLYLMSQKELFTNLCKKIPEEDALEAVRNTGRIADKCTDKWELKDTSYLRSEDPKPVDILSVLDLLYIGQDAASYYNINWDDIPIRQEIIEKCIGKRDDFHCAISDLTNSRYRPLFSLITYRTEYLLTYCPGYYFSSYLMQRPDSLRNIMDEAKKRKLHLEKPDVNFSEKNAAAFGSHKLKLGFRQIEGMADFADEIIQDRRSCGYYQSRAEYIQRMGHRNLEILENADAFFIFQDRNILDLDKIMYYEKKLFGCIMTSHSHSVSSKEWKEGVITKLDQNIDQIFFGCISNLNEEIPFQIPLDISNSVRGKLKLGNLIHLKGEWSEGSGALRVSHVSFPEICSYYVHQKYKKEAREYENPVGFLLYLMDEQGRLLFSGFRISMEGIKNLHAKKIPRL